MGTFPEINFPVLHIPMYVILSYFIDEIPDRINSKIKDAREGEVSFGKLGMGKHVYRIYLHPRH